MHHNKDLKKGAKELFKHMTTTQNFNFEGPAYEGLSDSVYNQLDQNALDALVASATIAKERIVEQGVEMTANDFAGLVADQYEALLPDTHDKHDKPGKKHGKKERVEFGF